MSPKTPLRIALYFALACLPLAASQPAPKTSPSKAKTAGADKEKKEPKWDVDAPTGLGPAHDVAIDVDEGTWMSVDVSPDGKEIVFDLLGDLYTIPFAGGEAKALTSDVAWQEQPTYSPNGKWIAFTSDQGGGDNIWIADRDGKNAKQISKESFRLLNSPTWTPDGDYIAARKHFTTRRSIGTGEIWLYHRGGGDGVMLTKRPNTSYQKDIGEPAFSPDGRFLYYSQDNTPGDTFDYNKDPNGEIYVVHRLDRKTGETETFLSGPGGAIRPTPSPDGKSLAFIRRIRGKSVLHVADARSGEVWPIWDGLDRDLQETWAIHGVYPHMSWTPDSKTLVFWAGGKIRRLDVASRQVSVIPFHVRATRKVFEAVRFPVEVAPAKWPVRMLRWVQVSPAGDRVVYQALGKLWIRDLPEGTPRRLTEGDDEELYPSFSRDGRSIAYATWDDEDLGAIRVVPAAGGPSRKLTNEPGHYVEPVFTPDGGQVVYRRISGGFLRTAAWSNDLGVWRIPAAGGEPVRITEDGALPQFGAESDRVYLTRYQPDGSSELFSVTLNGAEARTLAKSGKATEYHVSPDGRFVAFVELWNVYVAPFTALGGPEPLDLGAKASALPLTQVTKDSGWYVHWSGDSQRLHWSRGPELYTRELRDSFAFLDGAPEKLPEPAASGRNIGFLASSSPPSGQLAIVGARIVTMRGDEVIEDGTLVADGNRITAVGERASVSVPAGAFVVDGRGKTVIPGLVDVHWHGSFGGDGIIPETNWITYATLGFGVTTLHDPSNDTETVFAASELQRAGLITGPRIYSTGTILYGAETNYMSPIDSLEDARNHLRRMKAVGAISVKSYSQPRRDQRQQVLAAARELGLMVVPEGGSLFPHNMTMVVDGHTGVEHSIPLAKLYADVVKLWAGTKVGYTPTLGVGYGGIWGENYWYDKTHVWEDERLLSFVPREVVDQRSRRRVTAPDEEYNHFKNAAGAKKLSDAGVSVQMGAHGQREGLAAHWEMWMLAQGGMTPLEALRSATLRGAAYLGMDKDLGSLEPGKLADFVVLSANPLENVRNTTSIDLVVANGRVYDGRTMNEAGGHPKAHEPFFWQQSGRTSIGRASIASGDED